MLKYFNMTYMNCFSVKQILLVDEKKLFFTERLQKVIESMITVLYNHTFTTPDKIIVSGNDYQ